MLHRRFTANDAGRVMKKMKDILGFGLAYFPGCFGLFSCEGKIVRLFSNLPMALVTP
jgi:hypothetical protein